MSIQQQIPSNMNMDDKNQGDSTAGEESLSPLEQEVLDEYAKLAGNLGEVGSI